MNPMKILNAYGEAGAVVTDNKKVAELSANLKDLAFDKKRRFRHERLGFNYRMTDFQAILGINQLKRLDKFVTKRNKLAKSYKESLQKLPLVAQKILAGNYSSYHLFIVRISIKEYAKSYMSK